MAAVTFDLSATQEYADQPLVWRLGKLYNVVTTIRRARISDDSAYLALEVAGSVTEVEMAAEYLRELGLLKDQTPASTRGNFQTPEKANPQANVITVRLSTINPAQGHAPLIYRIGRDFDTVVNLERAAFDDEEGGYVEITISGTLADVQRAIAYLHTTGLSVNPRQRSVTDYQNL